MYQIARAVRSHAPSVWSSITIQQPLMILSRGQTDRSVAIRKCQTLTFQNNQKNVNHESHNESLTSLNHCRFLKNQMHYFKFFRFQKLHKNCKLSEKRICPFNSLINTKSSCQKTRWILLTEISSPTNSSSITTVLPASPNILH